MSEEVELKSSTSSSSSYEDVDDDFDDDESVVSKLPPEVIEQFDSFGVPNSIKHHAVLGAKATVWQFFHVLDIPIVSKKRNGQRNQNKSSTHLCLLCLKNISAMQECGKAAWKNALYAPANSSHATNHIKNRHYEENAAKQLLSKKKQMFDFKFSQASSSSVVSGSTRFSTIPDAFNTFKTTSKETNQLTIFKWIVYENKPFNTVQSPLFKAMFNGLVTNFTTMSRETFINLLDREFEKFVTLVKHLYEEAKADAYGMKFLSVGHDMWTTTTNDNVIGSNIRFITKDFELVQIACVLKKNNVSHKAQYNANYLDQIYSKRFGINLHDDSKFITSDTTSAARAVSQYIDDIEQVDCEMHLVNLAILYALGLRENVKTIVTTSESGEHKKEKIIITPGGSFVEGFDLIKKLRQLAKYFGTGQRKQKLMDIQERYALPTGIPLIDGMTRVASCHKLFQTSILHYYAMDRLYRDLVAENDEFIELWKNLSPECWTLVQELESLTSMLVIYAIGEAQIDRVTASKNFYFRRICERYCENEKYKVMELNERPEKRSTVSDWIRIEKPLSEFSDLGKRCLERLKRQLENRFRYDLPHDFIPIFVDPVTSPMAKVMIPSDRYEEAFNEFRNAHYGVFKELNKGKEAIRNRNREENIDNDKKLSVEGNEIGYDVVDESDPMYLFDQEFDVTFAASSQIKDDKTIADDIVNQWLNDTLQIDWKEFVVDNQHASSVRTVFGKICNADIFAWFRDVGVHKYESIALMARHNLQRMTNSGYQERVFSSAKGAMSKTQGRMAFDVLEKRTLLYHNKKLMENIK
jgi:hypothetical protein